MKAHACLWTGFWVLYVTTDLLSETVEHVDSPTIAFLFLNLPLQLVLAAIAALSWATRARRLSMTVARVNTLLIGTHVLISATLLST